MKNKSSSLKLQCRALTFFTAAFTIFTLFYSFVIICGILADYQTVGKWFAANFELLSAFCVDEPFIMSYVLGINPAMFLIPLLLLVLHLINRKNPIISIFSVIAAFLLWIDISSFKGIGSLETIALRIVIRYTLLAALLIYNTVKYFKALKQQKIE